MTAASDFGTETAASALSPKARWASAVTMTSCPSAICTDLASKMCPQFYSRAAGGANCSKLAQVYHLSHIAWRIQPGVGCAPV